MRVSGHRGAATRNADPDGVLLDGIWDVQTVPAREQPPEHPEPVLHIAGAAVTREHGGEAEAHQDSDLPQRLSNTRGADLGWPDDTARKNAKIAWLS